MILLQKSSTPLSTRSTKELSRGFTFEDQKHIAVDAYEDTPFHTDPEHKERMLALEEAMRSQEGEPVNFKYNHYFSPGTYTREMLLPAGTVATGQIHRRSSTNIITQGHVIVSTDEGQYDIRAPYTFISGPGVKKALYCVTDVIWITVHPWDGETTDIKELSKDIVITSYDALEKLEEN